jgi:hypothetical protein
MRNLCISACLVLLVYSCKKKDDKAETPSEPVNTELQPGLPEKSKSLSGYLFAIRQKTNTYINSTLTLKLYAAFNDPAANLIASYDHLNTNRVFSVSGQAGNIIVGPVQFGSTGMQPSNLGTIAFYNTTTMKTDSDPVETFWATNGNKTFKPFIQDVSRGFPQLGNTMNAALISISLGQGYTLDPLAAGISNYDSLMVRINGNSFASKTKRVGRGTAVVFTTNDLAGFYSGQNTNMLIAAFNYSHKTIEDKLHVFELASSSLRSIQFTQ